MKIDKLPVVYLWQLRICYEGDRNKTKKIVEYAHEYFKKTGEILEFKEVFKKFKYKKI